MIAVIFEVQPHAAHQQTYLDIATELKTQLNEMDGFISIERFQSLSDPSKLLSLSFWRDEAAIAQWRNTEEHRAAQSQGRQTIFSNYRIRIAAVVRDYGLRERQEAPLDSQQRHG
ncbi:antibiotic biosynthesis monooxygenase family protein [Undibacterium flavidum]|uniref:Antibiotic biosynthesis monooxygenase n=1 Tax=Undibacterium flavidum TaxID=2762297 RepID=A0ABR6Y926_9BURK|nr:antibiotic biosynthesis monooxygenase [Undibacterium flavidum]MBC3873089.1 antibiotic biosynthesis monooxygenase [Undibacterium flavidum]